LTPQEYAERVRLIQEALIGLTGLQDL
jgi:hypothetical protein